MDTSNCAMWITFAYDFVYFAYFSGFETVGNLVVQMFQKQLFEKKYIWKKYHKFSR